MPNHSRYSALESLALNAPSPSNGATPSVTTATSGAAVGTPAVRGREKHGRVKIAQAQLKAHGFDPGHPANGVMTAGTQNAVAAFQRAKGLTPTGTLDGRTQTALARAPRTAGRSTGARRMNGGPVLVNNAKSRNNARAGGRHSRAGGQDHSSAKAQNRSVPGASTSAMGIASRGAQGRPEVMKGQAEYESAGKRVPVIFSSTGTIAAGAQGVIVVQPQIEFRGENIVCDTTTAQWFSLVSLTVGVPPQVGAGTGNIPFSLFSPLQNGAIDYEMDLCNAGTQMTMTVINNDTTAHAFVAAIWGHEIVEVSGS